MSEVIPLQDTIEDPNYHTMPVDTKLSTLDYIEKSNVEDMYEQHRKDPSDDPRDKMLYADSIQNFRSRVNEQKRIAIAQEAHNDAVKISKRAELPLEDVKARMLDTKDEPIKEIRNVRNWIKSADEVNTSVAKENGYSPTSSAAIKTQSGSHVGEAQVYKDADGQYYAALSFATDRNHQPVADDKRDPAVRIKLNGAEESNKTTLELNKRNPQMDPQERNRLAPNLENEKKAIVDQIFDAKDEIKKAQKAANTGDPNVNFGIPPEGWQAHASNMTKKVEELTNKLNRYQRPDTGLSAYLQDQVQERLKTDPTLVERIPSGSNVVASFAKDMGVGAIQQLENLRAGVNMVFNDKDEARTIAQGAEEMSLFRAATGLGVAREQGGFWAGIATVSSDQLPLLIGQMAVGKLVAGMTSKAIGNTLLRTGYGEAKLASMGAEGFANMTKVFGDKVGAFVASGGSSIADAASNLANVYTQAEKLEAEAQTLTGDAKEAKLKEAQDIEDNAASAFFSHLVSTAALEYLPIENFLKRSPGDITPSEKAFRKTIAPNASAAERTAMGKQKAGMFGERMDKFLSSWLGERLTKGLEQGSSEAITEALQAFSDNKIATIFYDKNRDLFEGMDEGAFAGLWLGGVMGFAQRRTPASALMTAVGAAEASEQVANRNTDAIIRSMPTMALEDGTVAHPVEEVVKQRPADGKWIVDDPDLPEDADTPKEFETAEEASTYAETRWQNYAKQKLLGIYRNKVKPDGTKWTDAEAEATVTIAIDAMGRAAANGPSAETIAKSLSKSVQFTENPVFDVDDQVDYDAELAELSAQLGENGATDLMAEVDNVRAQRTAAAADPTAAPPVVSPAVAVAAQAVRRTKNPDSIQLQYDNLEKAHKEIVAAIPKMSDSQLKSDFYARKGRMQALIARGVHPKSEAMLIMGMENRMIFGAFQKRKADQQARNAAAAAPAQAGPVAPPAAAVAAAASSATPSAPQTPVTPSTSHPITGKPLPPPGMMESAPDPVTGKTTLVKDPNYKPPTPSSLAQSQPAEEPDPEDVTEGFPKELVQFMNEMEAKIAKYNEALAGEPVAPDDNMPEAETLGRLMSAPVGTVLSAEEANKLPPKEGPEMAPEPPLPVDPVTGQLYNALAEPVPQVGDTVRRGDARDRTTPILVRTVTPQPDGSTLVTGSPQLGQQSLDAADQQGQLDVTGENAPGTGKSKTKRPEEAVTTPVEGPAQQVSSSVKVPKPTGGATSDTESSGFVQWVIPAPTQAPKGMNAAEVARQKAKGAGATTQTPVVNADGTINLDQLLSKVPKDSPMSVLADVLRDCLPILIPEDRRARFTIDRDPDSTDVSDNSASTQVVVGEGPGSLDTIGIGVTVAELIGSLVPRLASMALEPKIAAVVTSILGRKAIQKGNALTGWEAGKLAGMEADSPSAAHMRAMWEMAMPVAATSTVKGSTFGIIKSPKDMHKALVRGIIGDALKVLPQETEILDALAAGEVQISENPPTAADEGDFWLQKTADGNYYFYDRQFNKWAEIPKDSEVQPRDAISKDGYMANLANLYLRCVMAGGHYNFLFGHYKGQGDQKTFVNGAADNKYNKADYAAVMSKKGDAACPWELTSLPRFVAAMMSNPRFSNQMNEGGGWVQPMDVRQAVFDTIITDMLGAGAKVANTQEQRLVLAAAKLAANANTQKQRAKKGALNEARRGKKLSKLKHLLKQVRRADNPKDIARINSEIRQLRHELTHSSAMMGDQGGAMTPSEEQTALNAHLKRLTEARRRATDRKKQVSLDVRIKRVKDQISEGKTMSSGGSIPEPSPVRTSTEKLLDKQEASQGLSEAHAGQRQDSRGVTPIQYDESGKPIAGPQAEFDKEATDYPSVERGTMQKLPDGQDYQAPYTEVQGRKDMRGGAPDKTNIGSSDPTADDNVFGDEPVAPDEATNEENAQFTADLNDAFDKPTSSPDDNLDIDEGFSPEQIQSSNMQMDAETEAFYAILMAMAGKTGLVRMNKDEKPVPTVDEAIDSALQELGLLEKAGVVTQEEVDAVSTKTPEQHTMEDARRGRLIGQEEGAHHGIRVKTKPGVSESKWVVLQFNTGSVALNQVLASPAIGKRDVNALLAKLHETLPEAQQDVLEQIGNAWHNIQLEMNEEHETKTKKRIDRIYNAFEKKFGDKLTKPQRIARQSMVGRMDAHQLKKITPTGFEPKLSVNQWGESHTFGDKVDEKDQTRKEHRPKFGPGAPITAARNRDVVMTSVDKPFPDAVVRAYVQGMDPVRKMNVHNALVNFAKQFGIKLSDKDTYENSLKAVRIRPDSLGAWGSLEVALSGVASSTNPEAMNAFMSITLSPNQVDWFNDSGAKMTALRSITQADPTLIRDMHAMATSFVDSIAEKLGKNGEMVIFLKDDPTVAGVGVKKEFPEGIPDPTGNRQGEKDMGPKDFYGRPAVNKEGKRIQYEMIGPFVAVKAEKLNTDPSNQLDVTEPAHGPMHKPVREGQKSILGPQTAEPAEKLEVKTGETKEKTFYPGPRPSFNNRASRFNPSGSGYTASHLNGVEPFVVNRKGEKVKLTGDLKLSTLGGKSVNELFRQVANGLKANAKPEMLQSIYNDLWRQALTTTDNGMTYLRAMAKEVNSVRKRTGQDAPLVSPEVPDSQALTPAAAIATLVNRTIPSKEQKPDKKKKKDSAEPESLNQSQQQPGNRGKFTPATKLIEIFKSGDPSTLLHEMVHWMRFMKASNGQSLFQIALGEHYDEFMQWATKDGSIDSTTEEGIREIEERIADGTEAFLHRLEAKGKHKGSKLGDIFMSKMGKNNPKLVEAFKKVSNMMRRIYTSLSQLVQLDPRALKGYDQFFGANEAITPSFEKQGLNDEELDFEDLDATAADVAALQQAMVSLTGSPAPHELAQEAVILERDNPGSELLPVPEPGQATSPTDPATLVFHQGPSHGPVAPYHPPVQTVGKLRLLSRWGVNKFKDWFLSTGNVPEKVHQIMKIKLAGMKQTIQRTMLKYSGNLLDAIQEHLKGDTSYGVDRAMAREQLHRDVNAYLRERDPARKRSILSSLPSQAIKDAAVAMRVHVDKLTHALLTRGIVKGPLAVVLNGQKGYFLHRNYEITKDENRRDRLLTGDLHRLYQEAIDVIITNRNLTGPMRYQKAQEIAENIIAAAVKPELKFDRNDPRAKGTGILMMEDRTFDDVAKARDLLWGLQEDPLLNYQATVDALGHLLSTNAAMKELLKWGMAGTNPLIVPETVPRRADDVATTSFFDDPKKADFKKDPIGANIKTILAGHRTTPEIAMFLKEVFDAGSQMQGFRRGWMNAVSTLNGLFKVQNTVFFWRTGLRNLYTSLMTLYGNGHLNPAHLNTARRLLWAEGVGKDQRVADEALLREMMKYNIAEAPTAAELKDYAKHAWDVDSSVNAMLNPGPGGTDFRRRMKELERTWGRGGLLGKFTSAHFKLYNGCDAVSKMAAYLGEKESVRKMFPAMTEDQVQNEAAKRTHMTMFSFDMTPKVVNMFRKHIPFTGPFVSFTWAMMRTSINILKIGGQDIAQGRARMKAGQAGGKRQMARGFGRLSSFLITAAAAEGMVHWMRSVFGWDEEMDEALREVVPDWDKRGTLVPVVDPESGELIYYNMSTHVPYSVIADAIMSIFRGDNTWEEKIWNAGAVMVSPFFEEQYITNAFRVLMDQRTPQGDRITNEGMSMLDKGLAMVTELAEPLIPGHIKGLLRMNDALPEGDFANEMGYFSEKLGIRPKGMSAWRKVEYSFGITRTVQDKEQALLYKTGEWTKGMRDASAMFTRLASSKNRMPERELREAIEHAIGAQDKIIKKANRTYGTFMDKMGVTSKQAKEILKNATAREAGVAGGKLNEDQREAIYGSGQAPESIRISEELWNTMIDAADTYQPERATWLEDLRSEGKLKKESGR